MGKNDTAFLKHPDEFKAISTRKVDVQTAEHKYWGFDTINRWEVGLVHYLRQCRGAEVAVEEMKS